MGKHRALGTTDLPSQADKHSQFFAGRHRWSGAPDTEQTEWVHVYGGEDCDAPPMIWQELCQHGARAVEVYR